MAHTIGFMSDQSALLGNDLLMRRFPIPSPSSKVFRKQSQLACNSVRTNLSTVY